MVTTLHSKLRTTMEITIRIKNVYGEEKIYPVCAKAEIFAAMLGQKTFTNDNLRHIRNLGYTVMQGVFARVNGEEQMVTSIAHN